MIKLTEPYVGIEETEAVRRVFESGWLAEGPKTLLFEQAIAEYTGADYAVAVSNATVGLELCLRANKIKGYVATSAFGHPATVRAIVNAGCMPLFVDVSLKTYNIDCSKEILSVDAYMPVSWGGNPNYVITFDGSPVIVDASCSLGAGFNYGDGTQVFSLHPRKLITTGEGGVVTTNSREVAESIRSLKNFGYTNAKFDDIRAAIGIEQLKKLPQIIKWRIGMAEVYDDLLRDVDGVVVPEPSLGHVYQTYAVYIKDANRDRIIKEFRRKHIETQVGAYALSEEAPNALLLGDHLLALPMSYTMTSADQKRVVDTLKAML